MSTEKRRTKPPYPAELRERAVRLVHEAKRDGRLRGAALRSVAEKLGCSRESLRNWVRQAGATTNRPDTLGEDERARLKALERENRELRQANEILRKGEPVKAPPVRARWRTRVSHRRSSTADPGHDPLHRRSSSRLRGRADLQGASDRSVDVPRPCRPTSGSVAALGAIAPRRGALPRDRSGLA